MPKLHPVYSRAAMKSPFSVINVMGFLLINILVSAFTTWVVVRTLVPPLVQAGPAIATPALSPTATSNLPAVATAASNATPPIAPAIPEASPPAPAAAQATPTLLSVGAAGSVNVRLSSVIYPSQLSREVVVIVNEGDRVNMTGWTLVPPRGEPYVFGNVFVPKNGFVNVHTTTGADVPTDLYWGLGEPMWQSGDELTLLRADGSTASTFKVK